MLKRFAASLLVTCALAFPAAAQNAPVPPYPDGAITVGQSIKGTTGSVAPVLPAQAGYTTWVCSFIITSGGTTSAATVNPTLTGLSAHFTDSATPNQMEWTYVFPASGTQGKLTIVLPQCIPASGQNQPITLTVPAGGAGTNVAASIQGFQAKGSAQ